jgi:hypothetical protein
MPNSSLDEIKSYIAELKARANKSQVEAHKNLNPLFKGEGHDRGPDDFVESSFLYMRSCDADVGSRPAPCPAFWLSPDLRVASITDRRPNLQTHGNCQKPRRPHCAIGQGRVLACYAITRLRHAFCDENRRGVRASDALCLSRDALELHVAASAQRSPLLVRAGVFLCAA